MILFVVLYLVNFLRTIVIIALVYFGIRVFTRYILPLLVDKGIKNMQQKMQDQHRQQNRSSRPEGEVTIEANRKKNNAANSNQGEYIDFEEVD